MLDSASNHRKIMEHAEWVDEACARFGDDPRNWRFVCPECGTVQTAHELIDAKVPPGFALSAARQACVGRYLDERVGCSYHASNLNSPLLVHEDINLTDCCSPPYRSSMPIPMLQFAEEDQPVNLVRRRMFGLEMDDVACGQIGGGVKHPADWTISYLSTSLEAVLEKDFDPTGIIADIKLPEHWRLVGLRRINRTTGEPEVYGLVNFKEVFTR